LLTDQRSQKAVETAEQYADGAATLDQLHSAWGGARWAARTADRKRELPPAPGARWAAACAAEADAVCAAVQASQTAARVVADAATVWIEAGRIAWRAKWEEEVGVQAALLRDLFGYWPVRVGGGITLPWRSAHAVSIAATMYAHGSFDLMPVLGAALSDAGCTDVEVLQHCGEKGPHVRGCWVVDDVLGKY
jgi:hypothetical protein